nr:TRIO and F-actin-binding protein-like [Penaeus vannamei]
MYVLTHQNSLDSPDSPGRQTSPDSLDCPDSSQTHPDSQGLARLTRTRSDSPDSPRTRSDSPGLAQTHQDAPRTRQTRRITQDSPDCTKTRPDSPRLAQTHQDSPRLTRTRPDSPGPQPGLARTHQDSPRLTRTHPDSPLRYSLGLTQDSFLSSTKCILMGVARRGTLDRGGTERDMDSLRLTRTRQTHQDSLDSPGLAQTHQDSTHQDSPRLSQLTRTRQTSRTHSPDSPGLARLTKDSPGTLSSFLVTKCILMGVARRGTLDRGGTERDMDSLRLTRTRPDSPGLAQTHQDSPRLTRTRGLNSLRRTRPDSLDSDTRTRPQDSGLHQDSPRLTRTRPDSFLVTKCILMGVEGLLAGEARSETWTRPDSPGLAQTHQDSPRLTRTRSDSPGLTHQDSPDSPGLDSDSPGLAQTHQDSLQTHRTRPDSPGLVTKCILMGVARRGTLDRGGTERDMADSRTLRLARTRPDSLDSLRLTRTRQTHQTHPDSPELAQTHQTRQETSPKLAGLLTRTRPDSFLVTKCILMGVARRGTLGRGGTERDMDALGTPASASILFSLSGR